MSDFSFLHLFLSQCSKIRVKLKLDTRKQVKVADSDHDSKKLTNERPL